MALASAMRRVVVTIALLDVPLSWSSVSPRTLLARATLAPLFAARERERHFRRRRRSRAAFAAGGNRGVAQAARTSAAPDSRDAFDAIAADALDASAIVTALLTLARDPGHRALQCEPVDLAAIVARCASDAAERARAGGVQIESSPASAIVDGDERRLRELARNLLENAIRHARSQVRIASRQNGRTCDDRGRRRRRRNSRRRSRARFRTLLPSQRRRGRNRIGAGDRALDCQRAPW